MCGACQLNLESCEPLFIIFAKLNEFKYNSKLQKANGMHPSRGFFSNLQSLYRLTVKGETG